MGFDSVLWLRAKADQENDGWPGPRTADFTVFTGRQVDFSCSQLSRFISLHFASFLNHDFAPLLPFSKQFLALFSSFWNSWFLDSRAFYIDLLKFTHASRMRLMLPVGDIRLR